MTARPTLVVIRHADGDREFVREIRSMNVVGDLLGSVLVMVCWKHALTLGEHGGGDA